MALRGGKERRKGEPKLKHSDASERATFSVYPRRSLRLRFLVFPRSFAFVRNRPGESVEGKAEAIEVGEVAQFRRNRPVDVVGSKRQAGEVGRYAANRLKNNNGTD